MQLHMVLLHQHYTSVHAHCIIHIAHFGDTTDCGIIKL